jgi:hypothetical protein
MADILDYIMLAGGAYYLFTRVREDKDDSAKRMAIGIGAGVLAGYKGLDIYRKVTNMNNSTEGRMSRDKLVAAGIGAAAGYLFGDKVINSAKSLTTKKANND